MLPIMSQLVRIYLALPATSAPAERVFSVTTRIISNKRSAINHEMAGKCLFLAENWTLWSEKLNFVGVADEVNKVDGMEG